MIILYSNFVNKPTPKTENQKRLPHLLLRQPLLFALLNVTISANLKQFAKTWLPGVAPYLRLPVVNNTGFSKRYHAPHTVSMYVRLIALNETAYLYSPVAL